MKRLAFLIAMVGVAGIALTAANARTHAATTTICHRTASKTNPYVKQAVRQGATGRPQPTRGHRSGTRRRLPEDGALADVRRPCFRGRDDRERRESGR